MSEIESESKFIWKFLLQILLLPVTLILIIFRKKEWGELLSPFGELVAFIFEPKCTIGIIIITTIATFATWIFLPLEAFQTLLNYPSDVFTPTRWFAFFSSAFIHANLAHLFGNMLGVFIFGRVVERKFGFGKTLLIYMGAMFISSVGDSLIGVFIGSTTGSLGASGALMGLVAAAMLVNPFYLTYELLIPLPIMIVAWLTILSDILGVLNPEGNGVAHFAHLFGYISIIIILFFFNSGEKEEMKKGLIINVISLIVLGLVAFFLI